MKQAITTKTVKKNPAKVCKRCKVRADIARTVTGEGLRDGLCKACRLHIKEMALQKKKQNPYKSDAQRRKFHAMLERGEISAKTVREFDRASKGKKLPKRVNPRSFAWETQEPNRFWVLLHNGESLARLRKNNDHSNYYTVEVTRGGSRSFKAVQGVADAKRQALVFTRKEFPGFKEYKQSQPSVSYVNRIISADSKKKYGNVTRIEPVAFSSDVYKLHFSSGHTQESKIPKQRNATAQDFIRHQKNRLTELGKRFQGEHNGQQRRLLQSDFTPNDKYRLGHLVQVKIKANGVTVPINFGGDSMLSADLRNNLHIVGKDARINPASLRKYGIKPPTKGNMTYLGKLVQFDYVTAKKHIENGETVRYFHKPGEVTKELPNVFVDHDGFPQIVGGGYDVWDVGVVN